MSRTPLLLVLLAALAVLGGLWSLNLGADGGVVHAVLAAEDASGPGDLAADGRSDAASTEDRDGGRVSLESAPPPPTAEELAALAAEAPDSQVWGRVLGAGEAPLEGVRVVARGCSRWMPMPADLEEFDVWGRGDDVFEAITDAEGRFHFDDLEPGQYGFAVRADGYAPFDRLCDQIPEHEQYDMGDLQLSLGVVVEGTVTDHRGKPVAGVRVLRGISTRGGSTRLELSGVGVPVDVTDQEGRFRAATLAPGGWHLIFDSTEHRVTERFGTTEPAGASERGLRVTLEPGLAISGRLDGAMPTAERPLRVQARRTDEQPTGETIGVEGAELERSRRAEVAPDGTYRVAGLAPNTQYLLRVQYQRKDDGAEVPEPTDGWRDMRGFDRATAMSGDKDVVLKYREECTLSWKVVDAETGEPVTNYVARVWGNNLGGDGVLEDDSGEPDTSHPGGAATFEHLRARSDGSDATLFVRAEGYRDLTRDNFVLRPGEEHDLGEVKLERAPRLPVRVVADDTGEPIEDARVFLAATDEEDELDDAVGTDHDYLPRTDRDLHGARTGADGVARVTAIPGRLCRVRAVAPGFAPCDARTTAPPHEAELELRLSRCGVVRVTVTDEEGAPMAGVQIRRQYEDPSVAQQRNYWNSNARAKESTDESGVMTFTDMRPGRWTLWVQDQREADLGWYRGPEQVRDDERDEVRVESGETVEVAFTVRPRGGARVRVTEGGEACVGALVQLQRIDPDGNGNMFWWGGGMEDPLRRVTDHEGRAVFEALELGDYRATISHPERRMPRGFEVRVEPDPRDEQVFELGVTAIEGVVVDASGEPLPDLRVDVSIAEGDHLWANDYRIKVTQDEDGDTNTEWESVDQRSLRTDRDGRYRLDGVRPELPLVVHVRGTYVVPENHRLDPLMRDEVRVGVDFVLDRAGVLNVEVAGVNRGHRGALLRGALRRDEDAGDVPPGATFETRSRYRGARRISSLLPGTWDVALYGEDDETVIATAEVEVVVGERRGVTLTAE